MREIFQDDKGRTWRTFINEWQQRKCRCDETGEVKDYPVIDPPPKPQRKELRIVDGVTVGMDTDMPSRYDW